MLNQQPENTPPNYNQLIYDLTKYNPGERIELAIARLELESLFDDDDDENRESYHYEDRGLSIDELDSDSSYNKRSVESCEVSLNSENIISTICGKISGNISGCSKHNKHDSGVAGMDQKSQTTLTGSPKNEEKDKISDDDLSLINDVIAICDNWEKYTDDVMRKKLDVLCHEKGIKPKKLIEIIEKSQLRSPIYYFIIGFMSEHAFGKQKDPQLAFDCYYKAADSGDPRGLVYVGWCYYKGMGTSTDPYKAFECFKSSAEKGYATAQCRVGACYEYGRGTPKDLEKAFDWYMKAAENGHETAKRRVSELAKLNRRGNRRKSFLVRLFLILFHY